jgi:hypothetical protein
VNFSTTSTPTKVLLLLVRYLKGMASYLNDYFNLVVSVTADHVTSVLVLLVNEIIAFNLTDDGRTCVDVR